LDPIDRVNGCTGKWKGDEYIKLKAWFRVERKNSVGLDGRKAWTLIVAHSGDKDPALSKRVLTTH
jgi:hypothetical protein